MKYAFLLLSLLVIFDFTRKLLLGHGFGYAIQATATSSVFWGMLVFGFCWASMSMYAQQAKQRKQV